MLLKCSLANKVDNRIATRLATHNALSLGHPVHDDRTVTQCKNGMSFDCVPPVSSAGVPLKEKAARGNKEAAFYMRLASSD